MSPLDGVCGRMRFIAATLLVAAVGCGKPEAKPAGQERLLVAAAASLRDLLEGTRPAFESAHPGHAVAFSFEASSTLARQIEEGAAFDAFLSADAETLERVRAHVQEDTIVEFLGNRLALAGREGLENPAPSPHALAAQPGKVALAGPAVPAGKYARVFLENIGVLDALRDRIVEGSNVRATLAFVESGAADYGIVYATDLNAARGARKLWVDEKPEGPTIRYVAGTLRRSRSAGARAYTAWLTSAEFRDAAEQLGFTGVAR